MSQQNLVEWFEGSRSRERVAANAEAGIRTDFPDVEPGSEEFYRLVLERAKG